MLAEQTSSNFYQCFQINRSVSWELCLS
jgi:hypothetical protein